MKIMNEYIGDLEVKIESVDNPFVRETYGTHYVIAIDHKRGKMVSQQVFQDLYKAKKYYKYFIEYYSNVKGFYLPSGILGPKKRNIRDIVTERKINKAPWFYNQGI